MYRKKLHLHYFQTEVPCPYCKDKFRSNIALTRHVLSKHNWNQDFLEGFQIVEEVGGVMLVKKIKEKQT